jgi:glycosyltransferase involved in cell wall biosynthesis
MNNNNNPTAHTPLVTIITPVFNGIDTLDNCLKSVATQNVVSFQHIVINALSTDSTTERLQELQAAYPHLSTITEADKGIYDAMNKGIAAATGEWLLFLGVDDILASPTVLAELFAHAPSPATQLLYGNVLYDNGNSHTSSFNVKLLLRNQLHHQGALYHRTVFATQRYDIQYRIYADYALNIRLWQQGIKAEKRDVVISLCGAQGLSGRATWSQLREICRVRFETLGLLQSLVGNSASIAKILLKKMHTPS